MKEIIDKLQIVARTLMNTEFPRNHTLLEIYRFTDVLRQCAEYVATAAEELKQQQQEEVPIPPAALTAQQPLPLNGPTM